MQKIVDDGTPFVSLILTVITGDFAISQFFYVLYNRSGG
jgi:hypothetical protein